MCWARLAQPSGPSRVILSLAAELAGQRQHEGQDRDRDRPAHAVGRGHQSAAVIGAGLDVDGIEADPEAGDDREPAIGREALGPDPRDQKRISASKPCRSWAVITPLVRM